MSDICKQNNPQGFTLVEIAVVMVILGLLLSSGVSIMKILTERKMRNETIDYMTEAEEVLFAFADINGRLPWADSDGDGDENTGEASGNFPYQTLNMRPRDPFQRLMKYELSSSLGTDRATTCAALTAPLTTGPAVIDSDGSTTSFIAAAAILSSGPKDSDGDGDVFDAVTSGTHQGDNTNGNPNYLRHPPTDTFDDFLLYIGRYELYSKLNCTGTGGTTPGTCTSGYTLRNNSGSNIRRSPTCSPFGNASDLAFNAGDSYDFWDIPNNKCSNFPPDISIAYSDVETTDADGDCKVEINAGFNLTEDSGW